MLPPPFRTPKPTIAVLYGAIVAQARSRFDQAYAVPDTALGRDRGVPRQRQKVGEASMAAPKPATRSWPDGRLTHWRRRLPVTCMWAHAERRWLPRCNLALMC